MIKVDVKAEPVEQVHEQKVNNLIQTRHAHSYALHSLFFSKHVILY